MMSVQFGKWNFAGEPLAPPLLERVRTLLKPYAPDGTTIYSDGGLSILYGAFHTTKESRHETQPQVTNSGAVLTWDGRLDNRAELLALLREGPSIHAPDSEIVAAAYERLGTAWVQKLAGDWALSLWNPHERSLLLAKDPIGTRPLYYSLDQFEVTWSTILDPLVLFAHKTWAIDQEYIAGCLSFFPAVHLTPYAGIHSVPPSCFVRIEARGSRTQKYWDFDSTKRIRYASDREYEEHFRVVFAEAVRRRLRSDHPVLAELSGGMDSSAIVCMADSVAARGDAGAPEIDTVSFYDDSEPNWNERPYFTKVEEQRGRTGLHIDVGSPAGVATALNNSRVRISPGSEGEPSASRKKLHNFIAAQGHRVLLSGFGGDEVLGGVPVPTSELADRLSRMEIRRFARGLKDWALYKRKPWLHLFWETLRRFLPATLVGYPEYLHPAPWLNPGFVARHQSALTGYQRRLRFFGPLPTFQENAATLDALRRQLGFDAVSVGPTYEKRYPYLDRDLLEFLFAVPREQLLRPGERRSLMRRALAGVVPAEVLNRKRKGFLARRPMLEILEQFTGLTEELGSLVTVFLGMVDPTALRCELQKARAGREISVVALLRTLGIEMWLRSLEQAGLLKTNGLRQVDSKLATNRWSLDLESHDLSAEGQSQ
jgi:asparagine synthase (glutamine-hydrolysing)